MRLLMPVGALSAVIALLVYEVSCFQEIHIWCGFSWCEYFLMVCIILQVVFSVLCRRWLVTVMSLCGAWRVKESRRVAPPALVQRIN
jgi:hypothetical protein